MLLKEFIFISIFIFCVSCGSDESNNENSQNNSEHQSHTQNEDNMCEFKMSAALSTMKTELLSIYKKLDKLGKENQDLDENIRDKFHKLQKNILDKLEEYIEGKFDSLETNLNRKTDSMEKNINRRLDTLENNIPDKADIIIMDQKFDAVKKIYSKSDDSLTRKPRTSQTSLQVNEKTNAELNTSDNEENIEHKVDMISKKILENTNLKLNDMEQNILSLKENITNEMNTLNDMLTQKIKKLEDETSKKLDSVSNTHGFWDCKKEEVQGHKLNLSRIDNENLKYTTIKTDSSGVSYLKMNFAAKGTGLIMIYLSAVEFPGRSGTYLALDIGEGERTSVYMIRQTSDDVKSISYERNLHWINTPGILSSTKYKSYYVKIEADEIEFAETGQSSQVFKYKDARFKTMKYIGFASYSSYSATILYDCPPQYEGTLQLL